VVKRGREFLWKYGGVADCAILMEISVMRQSLLSGVNAPAVLLPARSS
jgi:hypothetical protein